MYCLVHRIIENYKFIYLFLRIVFTDSDLKKKTFSRFFMQSSIGAKMEVLEGDFN